MSDCDHKKLVFFADSSGTETTEICPICDDVEFTTIGTDSKINE